MKSACAPPHGSAPRLYVDADLNSGARVAATEGQGHYILHVMRRGDGDQVILFNGRDGEWEAQLDIPSKRQVSFVVAAQTKPQAGIPDIWLMFAPLKTARLELLAEKATELGVSALVPVTTRRTVIQRVNARRLTAIVTEAAEQCERLTVPAILNARPLGEVLKEWPEQEISTRHLYFLDEGAVRTCDATPIAQGLAKERAGPVAILVGPEGGFTDDERDMLRGLPYVTPLIMGPRILRAETAALAALACWQALQGDWHDPQDHGVK